MDLLKPLPQGLDIAKFKEFQHTIVNNTRPKLSKYIETLLAESEYDANTKDSALMESLAKAPLRDQYSNYLRVINVKELDGKLFVEMKPNRGLRSTSRSKKKLK